LFAQPVVLLHTEKLCPPLELFHRAVLQKCLPPVILADAAAVLAA